MYALSSAVTIWLAAVVPGPAVQVGACSPPFIESVEIVREEVFDPEGGGLYRFANKLHIVTRESVVRSELLFAAGETLDAESLDQSERNLRKRAYLREARVEVLDAEGTVLTTAGAPELRRLGCAASDPEAVRIRVVTHDSWSTSIEGRLAHAGDRTLWSLGLSEGNFLGRGKELELTHVADIDRTSNMIAYRDPRVGGGPLTLEVMYADQSDGSRSLFQIGRPVLALDTGNAWRFRSDVFDQVQPLYRGGERDRELRHVRRRHSLEASTLLQRNDSTAVRLEGAFRSWFDAVDGNERDYGIVELGLSRTEHRYRKLTHLNHERAEDLNLGAVSRVRLGHAPGWFGAADRAWFLRSEHQQGAQVGGSGFVVGSAAWAGRLEASELRDALLEARVVWVQFLGARQLVLLSSDFRDGTRLDPERQLTLGAHNGLRGYPVNQFSGDRIWLATAEARWFVADDVFRLFSVGLTAFGDIGATWRGPAGSTTNGTRANLGVGLILGRKSLSLRNAAVRFDLAYALDPVVGRGRWLLSFSPARLDF